MDSLKSPVKVKHAEPLFIDLIRDLGARKGEVHLISVMESPISKTKT